MVCDVDSGVLQKIMEKYVINEQAYIWLQPMGDRQIYAIGNPEKGSASYYEKIDDCIRRGKLEEIENISERNKVLFQVSQKKYNLDAYSIMPQEMLRQNQAMLTRNLLLTAILMIVIITVAILYITKSLTTPLEQLTETVTKIRSGNTNLRVAYLEDDEIGQLGREFNEMLDEIQRLIGKEYENQLLLNKAEYKALQAQINPHSYYKVVVFIDPLQGLNTISIIAILYLFHRYGYDI